MRRWDHSFDDLDRHEPMIGYLRWHGLGDVQVRRDHRCRSDGSRQTSSRADIEHIRVSDQAGIREGSWIDLAEMCYWMNDRFITRICSSARRDMPACITPARRPLTKWTVRAWKLSDETIAPSWPICWIRVCKSCSSAGTFASLFLDHIFNMWDARLGWAGAIFTVQLVPGVKW